MTEFVSSGARTAAFYAVQILSWLGMFLVWFEGDQSKALVIPYFALHLGTIFLSASFFLAEKNSTRNLAIRTIGSFFLIQAIEGAVCLLPPTFTGTLPDNIAKGTNRYRTAYCGAVLVLISVFLSFLLAYTNFSAPSNVGSRVTTLRGLLYLVAVAACLVSSAISWSYDPVCPAAGATHPVTNATLVLTAFIILSSLLYGDGESDSVALLLACILVINLGPYFWYKNIVDVKVSKWRAHVAVAFTGLYLFIVGVFVDRMLKSAEPLGVRIAAGIKDRINRLDLLAVALGIAGSICTYAFNTTDVQDYVASYGLIIPFFSVVGVLTGTDAGKIIATFFGFVVLTTYDMGSGQTYTGYVRGGLMMMEAAVLLTVLSNAIRGRCLDKIVTYPAYVAIAQFVIGCYNVPTDYSKYFLIALTVIAAENYDDNDYGRVAYLLLAWNGFVWNFLLTIPVPVGVFEIINFVSALIYTYHYLKRDAKQAPSLKFGNDENAPIEAVSENPKEAA